MEAIDAATLLDNSENGIYFYPAGELSKNT